MAQNETNSHPTELLRAISNTGPLISAFQSSSYELLHSLFREIHISSVCVQELTKHGWEEEVGSVAPHLVVIKLVSTEEARAATIATEIARHPETKDPIPANHLGEAQVIALAQRHDYRNHVLLLDERGARAVAAQRGLRLTGFAGALLLTVRKGLITAEELKARLEQCQTLGTHYGASFIQQMHKDAKQERNTP